MSITTNKQVLRVFTKEIKVAVKEYRGSFEGLVNYVMSTPTMLSSIEALDLEETLKLANKAAKVAARAAKKAPKPVELDAEGNPIVRKRGRPKGSKNRTSATEAPAPVVVAAAPIEA